MPYLAALWRRCAGWEIWGDKGWRKSLGDPSRPSATLPGAGRARAVVGGGWFMISEMNFYWNDGGWGKVDYRYVYVRSGVTFIY